ncbi:DUF6114 domain-containing protein [Streptomyces sp. NPDC054765]
MLLTWRRWRTGRPFWGGLVTVIAGAEICAIPLAPLKIMLQQGIAGIPSVLMGLVMIVMALSAWFAPHYRGLAGVLTVLCAAAALVMSNLGGFLIGTVLGILGGSMIFAWQPVVPAEPATSAPPAASGEPGPPAASGEPGPPAASGEPGPPAPATAPATGEP